MAKKPRRLLKLDPPTKPFKVDGLASEFAELFSEHVDMKARQTGKTRAETFKDLFLPVVTNSITQEWVDRNIKIYKSQQELIKKMHEQAAEEEAIKDIPEQKL